MLDLPPIDPNEPAIVVTASRAAEAADETAASVTIIDDARIERLGEPLVPALLRLLPSTAVAQSGSAGTVSEVRIRGAEANHTLLFIDGIRANDPARGEAPRFELLNADIISRIEAVRGPQSALWGSEAIGGVIAVDGIIPGDGVEMGASAEAGSYGFQRTSAQASAPNIAAAVAWQRSDGIDIFGGGDRDGYRNLAGRLRASMRPAPLIEIGASGFLLSGRSQYDGSDPFTFERSHGLSSRDVMAAGRAWADVGSEAGPWRGRLSAAHLDSSSRNFFEGDEINRTDGSRTTLGGQIEHRFATGPVRHVLIAAAEHEAEDFRADDNVYFGATEQDRDRDHGAATVEWRATADRLTADVAVRRDSFNRFKDATSLRASLLVDLGRGFAAAGSYGEGIAQPTFFDLYGFFPGSFVGNPALRPESSKGFEVSLRARKRHWAASLTAYRQRLKDEIVGTFDFNTFLSSAANADGTSKRWGIEAEAAWSPSPKLRLIANYSYLDATQPDPTSGELRELRRPKHSGSMAIDGVSGRLTYGASLAYTGARTDNNFEIPPFGRVRLDPYWLAGARVGYAIRPGIELFARTANAFDEDYQDVFAYRTEGRSLHAGIRLADRR